MAFNRGSSQTTLLISVLIALVAGFLIGNISSSYSNIGREVGNLVSDDKLFTNQTAVIKGKIKSIEKNILTVQNSQGVTGSIEVADSVLINNYTKTAKGNLVASPSSDIKTIEQNKDATITLSKIDGTFKAIVIDFSPPLPALPSLPPVPKK